MVVVWLVGDYAFHSRKEYSTVCHGDSTWTMPGQACVGGGRLYHRGHSGLHYSHGRE